MFVCMYVDHVVVAAKVLERVQRVFHFGNAGLHRGLGLRHPLPPDGRPNLT